MPGRGDERDAWIPNPPVPRTRLPDLGKNILCGNSLIGSDIIGTEAWEGMPQEERERVNPFDYERAFPQVFKGKGGGFDAVIGNPPYIRIHLLVDNNQHEIEHYQRSYEAGRHLERSTSMLFFWSEGSVCYEPAADSDSSSRTNSLRRTMVSAFAA